MQEESDAPHGIRSIPAPARNRARPAIPLPPRPKRKSGPKWILWAIAGVLIIALGGLALFMLRPTTVTVTPKSHAVSFGATSQLVAYASGGAATGTLAYTVQTIDIDDSQVIQAQGTTNVSPASASGSITVYNAYSSAPVNLVKATRFQTPDGLVFKTPAAVSVPGKKGSTPGQVDVTVIAADTGSQYNIGPTDKFTLPGLQSSPDMYQNIYARSTQPMSGGESGGVEPAVPPATLTATISTLRSQLATKAQSSIQAISNDSTTVFPGMAQITYQDLPNTQESGGVRIHEGAHVSVPVFASADFTKAIASQVAADAENAPITLVAGAGFGAHLVSSGPTALGSDPLAFVLTGQGTLVWQVDTHSLASALAGRDRSAFQTIVDGFPGIQEAHARIEPFWSSVFPSDASKIQVTVTAPSAQ